MLCHVEHLPLREQDVTSHPFKEYHSCGGDHDIPAAQRNEQYRITARELIGTELLEAYMLRNICQTKTVCQMNRTDQSRWDSNMGLQSQAIAEVTQGFLLSIYTSNLYISKSH